MATVSNFTIALLHCGNINIANQADRHQKNVFFMPMGLFVLASELKRRGFNVEIIHSDIEAFANTNNEEIFNFSNFDALGMDCHWANQSLSVVDTAQLAKKLNPLLFIFLGGYTASYFAGDILKSCSSVNAVITGEGEAAIISLCEELERSKKSRTPPILNKVPDLIWRDNANQVQINLTSKSVTSEDMDRFEYADVSLLRNWSYYRDLCRFWTRFPEYSTKKLFFIEVGRGCRYNCSFCGGSATAQCRINRRTKMIIRSIGSVITTVRKAMSYGYSMFYSCYEEPGVTDAWYIEFFKRIHSEGIKLSFCYGSWKLPSNEIIDVMSECCEQVILEVSPETSNEGIRQKNKDTRLYYSNSDLERCLQYIGTKSNCRVQVYFGYFLPFDTKSTVLATQEYISYLDNKYGKYAEFRYSPFSTDPGSELFSNPDRYHIDIDLEAFSDYLRLLKEKSKGGEVGPIELNAFRPKSMGKHEADLISDMLYGKDLVRRSRMNLGSRVSEILADRKGRDLLLPFLTERIMLESKWLDRITLLGFAAMFPGDLPRQKLQYLSNELERVSRIGWGSK